MIERLGQILKDEPYFAKRMSPASAEAFVAKVLSRANKDTEPDPSVRGVAPDAEDDLVLATAVAAQADFLVTGDKGMLAIGTYRGVAIVTAREFLALLGRVEP